MSKKNSEEMLRRAKETTVKRLAEEHAEWYAEMMVNVLRLLIKEVAKEFFIHGYKHANSDLIESV